MLCAVRRTRIKICGVRDAATAQAAVDAGADAIGFVFEPTSSRYINPSEAWRLLGRLPPFVTTIGVTRNASLERFVQIERLCPTDFSQLHGDEDEESVRACGPRVIKVIAFNDETIDAQLRRWSRVDEVDAILVDAPTPGAGRAFPWEPLAAAHERHAGGAKPIILAGGLTPDNVEEAVRLVRPFAVDVSSGVESSRGVKDHDLMRAFCEAVRTADAAVYST